MKSGKMFLIVFAIIIIAISTFTFCACNKKDSNANQNEIGITSFDIGEISEQTISVEVDKDTTELDLSSAIHITKNCSFTIYADKEKQQAIENNKITELANGLNTYYVVVFSQSNNGQIVYTLNVWRNFLATITYYFNDELFDTQQVITHTTLPDFRHPDESIGGYHFANWGCEGFYVIGNHRFDAVIQPNEYMITFDTNGGTLDYTSKSVKYMEDAELGAPKKEGYNFNGWKYEDTIISNKAGVVFEWSIMDNCTLVADWTPKKFNITKEIDLAGKNTKATLSYNYATEHTFTATPQEGFTWLGWYEGDQKVCDDMKFTFMVGAKDVTYTAKFTCYTLEVYDQFPRQDAMRAVISPTGVTAGTEYTVNYNKQVLAGYEFAGWYDGNQKIGDDLAGCTITMPFEDKVLYCRWTVSDEYSYFNFSNEMVLGENICTISGLKSNYPSNIIVPEGVEKITDYAFDITNITSLKLPASVRDIGIGITKGCDLLESITIDEENPFYSCENNCLKLNSTAMLIAGCKNSIISDNFLNIGESAFDCIDTLTEITIPNSVKTISSNAFYGCENLKTVNFDITDSSLVAIHAMAFKDCKKIQTLYFPDRLETIGEEAFEGCKSLYHVRLNLVLDEIGTNAFKNCPRLFDVDNHSKLSFNYNKPFEYGKVHEHAINSAYYENGFYYYYENSWDDTKILLAYVGNEKNVVLPEKVGTISGYAFYRNETMQTIEFQPGLTTINTYAFEGCTGLRELVLPEGLKTIRIGAFTGCKNLKKVTIPSTLTSISLSGISNTNIIELCNNSLLDPTSATYGILSYDSQAHVYSDDNGSSLLSMKDDFLIFDNKILVGYYGEETDINIPNGIEEIYEYALYNNKTVVSVTIPDGCSTIGKYAFSECENLESVNLPNSITDIDSCAFRNCYKLESITIPENVINLKDYCFANCYSLTSITLPEGLISLGINTFYNCSSLTSIIIPDTVTIIGLSFSGCTNLQNIVIPNSITNIDPTAFKNCFKLEYNEYENALYLGNAQNPYLVLVKVIDTSCSEFTIHQDTKIIYSNAFADCIYLSSINIPANVTQIGINAFSDCRNIITATFGNPSNWHYFIIDKNTTYDFTDINDTKKCASTLTISGRYFYKE